MSGWTAARVASALGVSGAAETTFTAVATDTRTMPPGALFVALAGERYDAHAFLDEARRRGARGAVVRRGTPAVEGLATFEVADTLEALGLLARARRREITGPVVAVTGTNGKTSTKEMLASALGARWRVHATRRNLNNLVGVPLTILDVPADATALVVEAGASVPGEIARLRDIIEPTAAVVTNVSAGHVEGFGGMDGVLAEKAALAEGAPLAVVGTQPPALADRVRTLARRTVVAGLGPPADVVPDRWAVAPDGCGELVFRGRHVRLPLVGAHQVDNAVLALAVAEALDVDLDAATAALRDVTLPPGRCQVLDRGRLRVLYDAYNANPASVEAALATARAMLGGRRLVVALGTMRELGDESAALHERVARTVLEARPALVAVVGAFAAAFAPHAAALGDRLLVAPDPDTLGRELAARLDGTELVLLKASRGVRFERALPHLLPDTPIPCSTTS